MKFIYTYLLTIALSSNLFASTCNEPTTQERFNTLYKSVDKNNMPDQKKFNLISAYAKRECFTVVQLILFLDTIDNHKLQISTAQSVFNYIYDTENLNNFLSRFSDYEVQLIKKSVI